ncbi:MAG: hypothetical protein FJ264_07080 [Planctomycetes bacterium]|nr:hypothetical protein [Planctomycetota bacterium]
MSKNLSDSAEHLKNIFKEYHDLIINNGSNSTLIPKEKYNERINKYVKTLSPRGLLLVMSDNKPIVSFEDVKELDRELFKTWPYYSYEELDEMGLREIDQKWMGTREAKLKEYFQDQYQDCLERIEHYKPEAGTPKDTLKQEISISESDKTVNCNVFRCNGGNWTIKYKSETISPRDGMYLKYIALLLENPFPKKFTYNELQLEIEKISNLNTSVEQRGEVKDMLNSSMSVQSGGSEILDNEYIRSAIAKNEELEKQKGDAEALGNDEKAAELKEEIEKIERHVLALTKKGTSFNFANTDLKKQKDRIDRGITRCIKNIKKECKKKGSDHLFIGEHICDSICFKQGYIFYMPKESTNWNK